MPTGKREPKVFYPGLKAYFEGLRKQRGWKQKQTAEMAERREIEGLTYQALRGLEAGATKHPDPEALRAVATMYGVPYAEIVAVVVEHMYGLPMQADTDRTITIRNDEEDIDEEFTLVPLLADRIAAGRPLDVDESKRAGHLAFSDLSLKRMGVKRPMCVRVGHYEQSMIGAIDPDDIVLLCMSEEKRVKPKHDRIYAVNYDGGSMLKRVAVAEGGLMLISENPDKDKYPTIPVPIEDGATLLRTLVGEVMWRGQNVGGK